MVVVVVRVLMLARLVVPQPRLYILKLVLVLLALLLVLVLVLPRLLVSRAVVVLVVMLCEVDVLRALPLQLVLLLPGLPPGLVLVHRKLLLRVLARARVLLLVLVRLLGLVVRVLLLRVVVVLLLRLRLLVPMRVPRLALDRRVPRLLHRRAFRKIDGPATHARHLRLQRLPFRVRRASRLCKPLQVLRLVLRAIAARLRSPRRGRRKRCTPRLTRRRHGGWCGGRRVGLPSPLRAGVTGGRPTAHARHLQLEGVPLRVRLRVGQRSEGGVRVGRSSG